MKIPKWIKKNWLRLIVGAVIIGFFFYVLSVVRSCDDAAYNEDIKVLDEEISGLKEDNVKLEDEAKVYIADAEAYKKVVAEKEANIEQSRLRILELQKKRETVVAEVAQLPPSRLVEEIQEILDCVQVTLKSEGILFSVECSRKVLAMLKDFSLIKEELDETRFSLSESLEATQFQKMVSWKLYGALWKLGGVILNLKVIVKSTEKKFTRSEQQRKKSFWRGLVIGVAIGGGITVTLVIVIPLIKSIF